MAQSVQGHDMTTTAAPTEDVRSSFPKKHLVAGEKVLWEGRPSVVVYFLRSLLLFILGGVFGTLAIFQTGANNSMDLLELVILLILAALMFVIHRRWGRLAGVVALAIIVLVWVGPDLNGVVYFIPMIIGLAAFGIEYIVWSHTYFAISDRRIMTQYGIFNIMFADTQIDRVQNVTVVQPLIERILGYGDVMFATAGEMGGIKSDDPREMMKSGGAIMWENIPKPFQVRKVAEEIIFRATHQDVHYVQAPATVQPAVAPPAAAPVVSAPQAPSPTAEVEERMTKLKEMRDKGLVTEEEFQQKRKEILGRL